MSEKMRRLPYDVGRDPRNLRRALWRIGGGDLRKGLKRCPAGNSSPVFVPYRCFPKEPGVNTVPLEGSGSRIVDGRAVRDLIPHDITIGAARGREVCLCERLTRISAQEKRPVRPLSREVGIVPPLLYQDVDKRQGQSPVRSRTHLKKEIRLARDANAARVHGDDLHPPRPGSNDVVGQDERGRARIVTPEEKAPAVGKIGGGQVDAEGVTKGGIPVPVAHMSGRDPVGAPEGVEKAPEPALYIINRGPAPRALGEGHRPRAITLADGR